VCGLDPSGSGQVIITGFPERGFDLPGAITASYF
jgi:hypothetical protein